MLSTDIDDSQSANHFQLKITGIKNLYMYLDQIEYQDRVYHTMYKFSCKRVGHRRNSRISNG